MYGAILGDIIGSRFEGRRRAIKTKDFELFEDRSHFTDDSVLTFAVAFKYSFFANKRYGNYYN